MLFPPISWLVLRKSKFKPGEKIGGEVCRQSAIDLFQLVTEEVYEKHLQLSCREAESKDAHSYHCATPDCSGWCSYDDDVNTFFCYICHRVNCLTCHAIHDGQNCLEYQRELRAKKYRDPAAMLANSTLEVLVIFTRFPLTWKTWKTPGILC